MTPRIPVFLDRSRIKARQECPTYRYLHYHKKLPGEEIVGLQKPTPADHFAIGLAVHKGLEILLKTGNIEEAIGKEVGALLYASIPDPFRLREAEWLVKGLIYGWYRERFPTISRDYRVYDAEKTFQWEIHVDGQYQYLYNFRVDALLERKDDGRIAILDFKTAKKCDEEWARMFEHDLQPMLYTKAIDEILGVDTLGMIFEGLVKGQARYDTGKSSPYYGKVVQYSPFCYAYQTPDGFRVDYVKGAKKIFIGDFFSPQEWYDKFLSIQSPELLFAHVPPIKPAPLVVQNVISSIITAETNFQNKLDIVNACHDNYPSLLRHTEHRLFERHTNHCWKYGSEYQCPFYDICWTQGVDENPLDHGYILRVPNHDEEVVS